VEDRWSAAAALVDGTRRALYEFVRRQDHPVTREEAAEAQGISRGLAAFHLDKLVGAGLLHARYEPPVDRPRGRGRTPKVYESTPDGFAITIPERRYQLIAEILADAVDEEPADAPAAARRHAQRRGQELGAELRGADLMAVLAGLGFEPQGTGGELLLRNCPFHALAGRHTTLVCGLNQAFLAGLVDGLAAGMQADLVPRTGACCVTLVAGGGLQERGT
jgi:predicted ArsR family transcriptional regulator